MPPEPSLPPPPEPPEPEAAATPRAPSGSRPDAETRLPQSSRRLVREFFRALLIAALIIVASAAWEHTPDGEALEFFTYDRQQREAAGSPAENTLPVALVDITAFGPVSQHTDEGTELVTPRAPLTSTLQQIAAQDPAAIGVDVDFSPRNGELLPEDPPFFFACRELRDSHNRPVPVFLGVLRAMGQPPERWLNSPDLVPLAAGIGMPRTDSRKMPLWTRAAGSDRLCSLSARLAAVYPGSATALADCAPMHGRPTLGRRSPAWPGWLAGQFEERTVGPELEASEFLVDYSPANSLLERRVKVDQNGNLPRELETSLTGKLVLVGYATPDKTTDMVRLPGHDEEEPGILTHACAANTLVARPFFRLRPGVEQLVDVLLAGIMLGAVFGVRWRAERRGEPAVNVHRLQALAIAGLVVATCWLGTQLPIRAALVWADYAVVALALLLHPYVEHLWEWFWEFLPVVLRRSWQEGNEE